MKELDLKECEFDNPESCYHLTRAVHHYGENGIDKKGLGADIGIRSRDGVGNEKTAKVFFAKSVEGTLIFLNRTLNIFRSAVESKDLKPYLNALSDDKPEIYEQIFEEKVHDDMSEEEMNEATIALGEVYFQRGVYYKLDLKHSTKEEFEKMSSEAQDEIDYFIDDVNEEKSGESHTINNMHTRSGRPVKPEQMSLMTVDGSKSALDVVVAMSNHYRNLNPGEKLPVLVSKKGVKDIPLLEMLVDKVKEKNIDKNENYKINHEIYKDITMSDIGESKQTIKSTMEIESLENGKENIEEESK